LEKLGKSEDLITYVADRHDHDHDQRYAIDPAKAMAELDGHLLRCLRME
jgi:dTDP-glucose 4,6-dehydratase